MKKVFVLTLIMFSCSFYGQQGEERPKPPKFSASDRAGVFYYEAEETTQNIKVKEDSDLFYDVAKALRKYNAKVKETAFLNTKNFIEIDLMVNEALNKQGEAPVKLDPAVEKKKQEEVEHLRNVIPTVYKKIKGFEEALNENLKSLLKEKQFKKWLKYQKKKRKALLPERPQSNNGNGKMSRSGFGNGINSGQRRNGAFR